MKPSSADQDPKAHNSNDVDALLRRALDSDSITGQRAADRIVRAALDSTERSPERRPAWRLATVAFGAAAVAAWLVLTPARSPGPDLTAPPVEYAEPRSRSIALEITNADGPIIVSAAAGSKIVLLPTVPLIGGAS